MTVSNHTRGGRIGFMQGRLSPLVDGKIQAFPATHWRDEIALAGRAGYPLIEWTLDHEGLKDNPFMTDEGRREAQALCREAGVVIASVTADCFMQAPFFKAGGARRDALIDETRRVLEACNEWSVFCVVLPLVDDGSVTSEAERADVLETLTAIADAAGDTRIVFESDFAASDLAAFIAEFPEHRFGINYDIGNSAAAGFDPAEEIAAYGRRILNVHVKDRPRGGTTVPLGEGDADFPAVFRALRAAGYAGDYVLQTARAAGGDHEGALNRYRDLVRGWLQDAA